MEVYTYIIESKYTAGPVVLVFSSFDKLKQRFIDDVIDDDRDPLAYGNDGDPDNDNRPSLASLKAMKQAGAPLDKLYKMALDIYLWFVVDGDGGLPYYHFDHEGNQTNII